MQSTEVRFEVYGAAAAAAISDMITIHEIFPSVFVLLSLPHTLLNTFLCQSLSEGPECEGSRSVLSRSDRDLEDGSFASWALAVFSGSTDPSCSVFRGCYYTKTGTNINIHKTSSVIIVAIKQPRKEL